MKNIQAILRELYEIDPDLRNHEKDLRPLIEYLLANDPARLPDEHFVEELRKRLNIRATTLTSFPSPSFFSFLTMNNFTYAIAGAVVTAVIAVPTAVVVMNQSAIPDAPGTPLFTYSVEEAAPNAFNVAAIQSNARTQAGGGSAEMGMGGGGGVSNPVAPVATDSKLIAPDIYPPSFTNYEFIFDGELPALPEGTVSVFERQKSMNNVSLATLSKNFNVGLMDLNKFGGASVDSISFSQNTQFGYMINLMLKEGTLSINQNWEKWPHPENDCQTEACWAQYRLKPEDVLPDEEAISIAKQFANDYGIDLSRFGEPEVQDMWRMDLMRSARPVDIYVPDAVTVIFPIMIEGQKVYDEGGTVAGVSISVNNRQKRVSDVWGLQNEQYRKSDYAAVASAQVITDYLKDFGKMPDGFYTEDAEVKIEQVKLENPTIGFVRYYSYEKNTNQELYVPAMIFTVVKPEGSYYYGNYVTVPLAQEVLDTFKERRGGMPIPLMMETPAAGVDAADTAVAPAPRGE